jgi:hypothetical protein
MGVSVLLDVPVDGGTRLLVEADPELILGGGPTLAAPEAGRAAASATRSLEASLEQLDPLLHAVREKLRAAAPERFSVEFGVKIGGETGLILAKGTAEVNLKITMTWEAAQSS